MKRQLLQKIPPTATRVHHQATSNHHLMETQETNQYRSKETRSIGPQRLM